MAFYIDTSALVKLVVAEAETPALLAWLKTSGCDLLSCDLARTELLRAVRRAAPGRAVQAHAVLETLTLLEVTGATFEQAGRLGPSTLRTSDSLHLAAALDLGDDLEGLVTYDDGLAEAAELNGVLVVSPT